MTKPPQASRWAYISVLLAAGLWTTAFLGMLGYDVYVTHNTQERDEIPNTLVVENARAPLSSPSHFLPMHPQEAVPVFPKLYQLETHLKQLSHYTTKNTGLDPLNPIAVDQDRLLQATPTILPTRGWISSRFGYRKDPFTGLRRMHTGIDIATYKGTTIHATADGIVVYAGRKSGYGKVLMIYHGYGITTLYAHNSQHLVKVGDQVQRGDEIAFVGSTGRSTSSHLHYEVRMNDIPVNPKPYISGERIGPVAATLTQASKPLTKKL